MVRNNQLYHEDGIFQNSKRLNFRNPVKKTPVLHLLAGVEEAITQEPEVVDPKCGISNMNIPPDRIHLEGVPGLISKILDHLPLSLWKNPKTLGTRVDSRA